MAFKWLVHIKRLLGSTTNMEEKDHREFFTDYGDANRYILHKQIGEGSYGVVCAATDSITGEKVAIKRITDIFDVLSDAKRILREIKLLGHFGSHPDIVQIKHIMLPASPRKYKDIYVVFELMDADLHQVIRNHMNSNDSLTTAHYVYILYQLLCGIAYVHSTNVFHRDLKPKNVLVNADCTLKICDFGLARPNTNDGVTACSPVFWTDYVATRWYRAPELCGSFFTRYTPAIDMWSVGCIFAEVIMGRPLFPGKNEVDQLELITNMLGSPSVEAITRVRNGKAQKFLSDMKFKPPKPFETYFRGVDPSCVNLLKRLISFDPFDRPTAVEALEDPMFDDVRSAEHEMKGVPVTKSTFAFEKHNLSLEDVRYLIYQEILEYHPKMKGNIPTSMDERAHLMYPSAVDRLKRGFVSLQAVDATGEQDASAHEYLRQSVSLPPKSHSFAHKSA